MTDPEFLRDSDRDRGGISGVVVGIVTDNADPEKLGRVKLTFPWRDADDESYWARVATPMAGAGMGTYFLPEVDDEVLVAFEDGDIHKPFVIGSLWNGKQKPPQKNKEGKNDVREVRSRSDHTIQFDDAKEGSITIQTSKGNEIVIDDSGGSETIAIRDDEQKNTITLDSSSGEVSIDADSKLKLSAQTVDITGKKKVKITGNQQVNISSKAKLAMSSKGQVNLSSNSMMGIKSTGILTVKGSLIQLN